ncbi:MAG: membrane protein [Candidatus Hydrogenedentota bacterium]
MTTTAIIACVIFGAAYVAILTEKVHKTVAALAGGVAMVILGVVSEETAFASIDLSVILLLTGMMILTHYLAESGFFEFVAIHMVQVSQGRPIPLIILMSTLTAVLSALVDNVTTVLLVAPVTFLVCQQLELKPGPYLIVQILACNEGGTATLIGDPPNILIGSKAGLSFNEFLMHLAPIVAVCHLVLIVVAIVLVRHDRFVPMDVRVRVREMHPRRAIRSMPLLIKSGSVLLAVLCGFLLHGVFHVPPASIALSGAALIMVLARTEPDEAFKVVEWSTLFFFVGLFMLVAGLVEAGVIQQLADLALRMTGGDLFITSMVLLWLSAFAAMFVGAVPITATLIPMVQSMIPGVAAGADASIQTVSYALWWSLALGVCLGSNGTILGGAANIVVIDIARRNGLEISFARFMRYGVPYTFVTLLIASVYVAIRYIF